MTYTKPLLLLFSCVAVAGLLRVRNCRRKLLLVCGMVSLLLLCWPPVDWLLARPLEAWYPVQPPPQEPAPQAIVVLSSSVEPPRRERPFPVPDHETVRRSAFAAWLHTSWPELPVLACGAGDRQEPDSRIMRQLLRQAGVPDSLIWTEERSRSTYQNALYGAGILRERGISRIALVVDARSMLRASACFRKQGIQVIPAPSSFRIFGTFSEELLPDAGAITSNELTLHEVLGMGWYWMRGWI